VRKLIFFVILIFAATVVFVLLNTNRTTRSVLKVKKETAEKVNSNMKIMSLAFGHNLKIPGKYTCDGENVNPPLEFLDVPENAKSLVLIVDDPDAHSKTWVHWVVFNINPKTTKVNEDSIPQGGIEGRTDFGKPGYGGPCPPSGTHRYFFKLYALDLIIPYLDILVNKKMVEEAMKGHIVDSAELIGLYGRE